MSLVTIFVAVFAAVCLFVSGYAAMRIWKADDFPNKPLWILGCLFGFIGFSLDPTKDGHLLLNFGVQIPVVYGLWSSAKGLALKALFPVIAVVALAKLREGETDA